MILITQWAVFLAVNGAALVSAYALASRLLYAEDRGADRLLTTGLCYLAHVHMVTLAAGLLVRDMSLPVIAVLSLATSAAILALTFRSLTSPFPGVRRFRDHLRGEMDWVLGAGLVLYVIAAAAALGKLIILPPLVWDVWAYHLPPAAEWYQAGRILPEIDSPVARINFQALGLTLLNYWYFIFFTDDFLVELPQFLWWLLILPAGYAMLRQAGLGLAWSLKFSLLAAFTPAALVQAATAQDHLALAVSFVIGLHFLNSFAMTREPRYLIPAALALGLCLGYKITAPMHVAIALAVLAWVMRRGLVQAWMAHRGRLAVTVAAGGLVMVALNGYWYVKNVVLYGGLTGGSPAMRAELGTEKFSYFRGLDDLLANVRDFVPRILDSANIYDPDLAVSSGFGPQFFIFGLTAALLSFRSLFPRRNGAESSSLSVPAWSVLLLLLFYFTVYYSDNNYRLFIFLPLVLVPVCGRLLDASGQLRSSVVAGTVNFLVAVLMVWCVFATLPPSYTYPSLFSAYAFGPSALSNPASLSRHTTRSSDYRFLASTVPEDEAIAFTGHRDSWIYPYYGRHWRRKVVFVHREELVKLDDAGRTGRFRLSAALRHRLDQAGVRLVHSVSDDNYQRLELHGPGIVPLSSGLYLLARGAG